MKQINDDDNEFNLECQRTSPHEEFFVDSAINCWCSGGAVEDAFKIKTLVILSFRRRPSINLGSEMNVKTLFTFVNPDFDATEQRR